MFLDYLSIFFKNIEFIYKQKQCLVDALYQIAKGIIKTAVKFMHFLFLNKKIRENFSPTKFSRVIFCIEK